MYVVVRFRSGYPEVSDRNALFRGLKAAGRLGEGAPGAELHAQVAPQPTEVIVTKRRVGPPRPEAEGRPRQACIFCRALAQGRAEGAGARQGDAGGPGRQAMWRPMQCTKEPYRQMH